MLNCAIHTFVVQCFKNLLYNVIATKLEFVKQNLKLKASELKSGSMGGWSGRWMGEMIELQYF